MPQAAQGVQPLVRNEVTQNSPDTRMSGLFAPQDAHTGLAPVWKRAILSEWIFLPVSYFMLRYRKVTIWARVQLSPGLKVVAVVPLVTPLATAHMTASP